jgi:hypothetical protein
MFRGVSFATLALIGAVLAGCAPDQPEPPQAAGLPATVVGVTWRWAGFTTPV